MDFGAVWMGIGGGAAVAGLVGLARVVVDHVERRGQRALDREERWRRQEWDAEARLERLLTNQLDEAEHRLDRCAQELEHERARTGRLERACLALAAELRWRTGQTGLAGSERKGRRVRRRRLQAEDSAQRAPE